LYFSGSSKYRGLYSEYCKISEFMLIIQSRTRTDSNHINDDLNITDDQLRIHN
jgi:hypothetical protein